MMKKNFLCLLLLISMGVMAKPYDHSLGFVGGSFNGFSYKTLPLEHFAVQTDAGVHFTIYGGVLSVFEVNPMFMYQGTIMENSVCSIDWFTGGGLSMGFMTPDLYASWDNSFLMGEFGLNAIAGIEFAFSKAVALSFDFRPGYGLAYISGGTGSFFDWGLQLGLRFYL